MRLILVNLRSFAAFLVLSAPAALAPAQNLQELEQGFRNPSEDAKIMMRWWWFGPALTKADIDRDLQKMKEGGIGGVEVQPVYPVRLEGNYPYLSDQFIEALRYTRERTSQLGMRMDLTLGSGWPYGGPHIPITQAAGRLRVEKLGAKEPYLADGEKLISKAAGYAFISSRTGMQVKRASINAEGFVLDHYDRAALDHHLNAVAERLFLAFKGKPPRAVFSDSLEVFASDWTPDFIEQFRRRRGYDITPHLPALVDDLPDSGAVRNDWARTLTELCNENYLAPLAAWAHKHGTLLRSQTYGVPPVTLASQSLVDLPEGEQPHWRKFTPARWASSAAHLYNKPVSSTETWTWLHSPAFRATPLDMKAEGDLHFLEGITQLVGHGWPSPAGTAFYAAAAFSDTNPWYNVMPDVAAYLQRITWLLRQGQPANDVALYIPTADARASFKLGNASVDRSLDPFLDEVIPQLLDAGYNFDFTDDETIEKLGVTHPILVLPHVERMSAAAARKLRDYKGIIIATGRLPSKAPGLKDEAPQLPSLPITQDLMAALRAALPPDVTAAPGIGFIHRKTASADIYFLANTTNQRVQAPLSFRAQGALAVWDPFGQEISDPGRFEPYQSRVVVVHRGPAKPPVVAAARESQAISLTGGPWPESFSGIRLYTAKFLKPSAARVVLGFGEGTVVAGSQARIPG